MRDTSKIHDEIHVSQMHPERDVSDMKETCGIHAKYMRDTCILRGNQDTFGIHAEYMRNTCGIHVGYMWDTYLGGLGECIDAIIESSAPIRPPMSSLCRNGSSPARSSSSIFSFVMATLIPAGLPPWLSAKRSNFSCSPLKGLSREQGPTYPRMYPYVSDMYRECILCVMYLRVKIHCILNVS